MSSEDLKNTAQETVKEKAKLLMDEFLQGQDPKEKAKELANDAAEFIRKNPWAAVLGAVAIGYLLGNMTARRPNEGR